NDAGSAARGAPQASRIGSLVAETIVLVNPARNYAQFLLRALLPVVLHVVIALAAGYAVGSEFSRRSIRTWLACAGGRSSPWWASLRPCSPSSSSSCCWCR